MLILHYSKYLGVLVPGADACDDFLIWAIPAWVKLVAELSVLLCVVLEPPHVAAYKLKPERASGAEPGRCRL